MERIEISTPYITLEGLLKFSGFVETGGMAKELIRGGAVLVNGQPCTQRGRKLYPGDRAELDGQALEVAHADTSTGAV